MDEGSRAHGILHLFRRTFVEAVPVKNLGISMQRGLTKAAWSECKKRCDEQNTVRRSPPNDQKVTLPTG